MRRGSDRYPDGRDDGAENGSVRLIVYLDQAGLVKVEIEAPPEKRDEAHHLWSQLRPAVEQLGVAMRRHASETRDGHTNLGAIVDEALAEALSK